MTQKNNPAGIVNGSAMIASHSGGSVCGSAIAASEMCQRHPRPITAYAGASSTPRAAC